MGRNPNHSNCMTVSHMLLSVLLYATNICTSAFDITYFLSSRADFSTFSNLLSKSGIDKIIDEVDSSITVLAVDNSAAGPLLSQSQSSQRAILATHVLLDYYDIDKLEEMKHGTQVTNLYQKIGNTSGKQGYIIISKDGSDFIFSSAVDGAPKSSRLVKEVGSKPFDVIVLQVSSLVFVPGLNDTAIAMSPALASSPNTSPVRAPSPAAEGPAHEEGPTSARSPSRSTSMAPNEANVNDEPPAKLAPKSGGGRVMVNVGGLVAGILALTL